MFKKTNFLIHLIYKFLLFIAASSLIIYNFDDAKAGEIVVREFVAANENPTKENNIYNKIFADGAGPSNLVPINNYLLAFDPWSGDVKVFDINNKNHKYQCQLPKGFSPWRSLINGDRAFIISEPQIHINHKNKYYLRPVEYIEIKHDDLQNWRNGDCVLRSQKYKIDNKFSTFKILRPIKNGKIDFSKLKIAGLYKGTKVTITASTKNGQIFSVRQIGDMGEEKAVSWTEILAEGSPDQPPTLRTITFVAIIRNGSKTPEKIMQIEAANPRLAIDKGMYDIITPSKMGFEFLAAAKSSNGQNKLFIMTQNKKKKQYIIQDYDFPPASQDTKIIKLWDDGKTKTLDAYYDGEDPINIDIKEYDYKNAASNYKKARKILFAYATNKWRLSEKSYQTPCQDEICRISYSNGQLVSDENGSDWVMKPRQLLDMQGKIIIGVPYSFAGKDCLKSGDINNCNPEFGSVEFNDKVNSGNIAIGHIKDSLQARPEYYPAGIDCSSLVAAAYEINRKSTSRMVKIVNNMPSGPSGNCPLLIRNLNDIRPGDIILHKGHVVIFDGFAKYGNESPSNASFGLRVFEATSRCGKVCMSIYDPSYFENWFIFRISSLSKENCPLSESALRLK